jgi:hypothetical protein
MQLASCRSSPEDAHRRLMQVMEVRQVKLGAQMRLLLIYLHETSKRATRDLHRVRQHTSCKRRILAERTMMRFIMDRLVMFAHAQSIMPSAATITHLADFIFCHECIIQSTDLVGMCSEW